MATIIGQRKTNQLAVIPYSKAPTPRYLVESVLHNVKSITPKFNEFWTLMDTIQAHGYLRAAIGVYGRAAVSAWWTLQPAEGEKAAQLHFKRLMKFYEQPKRSWKNIADFSTFASKLLISVQYLRYFGQAAFVILRDDAGTPVGLDFLTGFTAPNVDEFGAFKSPAFLHYPTSNPGVYVGYAADEIVFITVPDFRGAPSGGTDVESLATYTLPLDLSLQLAAREYLSNLDRTEVIYSVSPDISTEAFDNFVNWLKSSHGGASNFGKSMIALQGEFSVHEMKQFPKSLPYQESRTGAREEEMAVAGVNGAKLGLTDKMTSANLRELRKEFYESSLLPLLKLIEKAFNEQIHIRLFGFTDWEFTFKAPDFLTAVERATVHMRYHDMGALTPNQIRSQINQSPRTDPAGAMYIDEKPEMEPADENQPQGSPPEGRPVEPDDPGQIDDPVNDPDAGDPVRGDRIYPVMTNELALYELRQWKRFIKNRFRQGKKLRDFQTQFIPKELVTTVTDILVDVKEESELDEIFKMLEEKYSG